jgi:hypothetical protein
MRVALLVLLLFLLAPCGRVFAAPMESVDEAICRLIDASARARSLPVELFARLIWRESAFRNGAVSPKGARGVAQFMPGTALARGLADPFDPEQAIPHSASYLFDLRREFGNFGLAAAAYNAGPARVQAWLAKSRGLPDETRRYVIAITGLSAEDWARRGRDEPPAADAPERTSCLQVTAALRRGRAGQPQIAGAAADAEPAIPPPAPWGVQLAGNFSKDLALQSYAREARAYANVLGAVQPMIIGTLLRSRGTKAFYRVRVPAQTREAAQATCSRIREAGGHCIVLRS